MNMLFRLWGDLELGSAFRNNGIKLRGFVCIFLFIRKKLECKGFLSIFILYNLEVV